DITDGVVSGFVRKHCPSSALPELSPSGSFHSEGGGPCEGRRYAAHQPGEEDVAGAIAPTSAVPRLLPVGGWQVSNAGELQKINETGVARRPDLFGHNVQQEIQMQIIIDCIIDRVSLTTVVDTGDLLIVWDGGVVTAVTRAIGATV